jgi:hypothetical protein
MCARGIQGILARGESLHTKPRSLVLSIVNLTKHLQRLVEYKALRHVVWYIESPHVLGLYSRWSRVVCADETMLWASVRKLL